MKILFVGDEPSAFNRDPKKAFLGARCYPRLLKWIEYLEVKDYELLNSHKSYLLDTVKYLYNNGYKVITLGNKAHNRLKKIKVEHHQLGHPSGLNRKLNSKAYELEMLTKCKEWIYNV